MMKPGIHFKNITPITAPHISRMDVACFIGMIPMRENAILSKSVEDWVESNCWSDRVTTNSEDNGVIIEDAPIPVEAWEMFDSLFDSTKRLDKVSEISSAALQETITISEEFIRLYVVVDSIEEHVTFTAGLNNIEDVVDTINDALNHAEATLVPAASSGEQYLVLKRTNTDTAGSINVYKNDSLGFNYSDVDENQYVDTYLGSTVKAFFQQGGKKCYVVRMGNPLPIDTTIADKIIALSSLLTGNSTTWSGISTLATLNEAALPKWVSSETEQEYWHGIEHMLGLQDVSYLSFPDLPDLLSSQQIAAAEIQDAGGSSGFTECVSDGVSEQLMQSSLLQAPRCNQTGYKTWSLLISHIARYLRKYSPETMLISSVPLPTEDIEYDWTAFLQKEYFNSSVLSKSINDDQLQLTYPWLMSNESERLPSKAELPEGRLIGLLAKQALKEKSYFSIAGSHVSSVYDLYPSTLNGYTTTDLEGRYLAERISMFSPVPTGMSLQSDVTPASTKEKQYAVVKRLTMYVMRTIRHVGWLSVFEPHSPGLWNHLERTLSHMLLTIYQKHALRGATKDDAFSVACNKTTMTQNDIDNGRVITLVEFQPALPIEKIIVALALDQQGNAYVEGDAA